MVFFGSIVLADLFVAAFGLSLLGQMRNARAKLDGEQDSVLVPPSSLE